MDRSREGGEKPPLPRNCDGSETSEVATVFWKRLERLGCKAPRSEEGGVLLGTPHQRATKATQQTNLYRRLPGWEGRGSRKP